MHCKMTRALQAPLNILNLQGKSPFRRQLLISDRIWHADKPSSIRLAFDTHAPGS
jgi:hypothetical protein